MMLMLTLQGGQRRSATEQFAENRECIRGLRNIGPHLILLSLRANEIAWPAFTSGK